MLKISINEQTNKYICTDKAATYVQCILGKSNISRPVLYVYRRPVKILSEKLLTCKYFQCKLNICLISICQDFYLVVKSFRPNIFTANDVLLCIKTLKVVCWKYCSFCYVVGQYKHIPNKSVPLSDFISSCCLDRSHPMKSLDHMIIT